ncbi:MarR family winged helix-turn-helix transcriptional regulator [Rhizobium paknamense]|uniref:DNA-binding MarR family transcriptional regulator n=1 Tax=Rhizobium paknamense TaxID=1206817 RepID=A0ABU0IAE6_9HYPH|nr:MarR family transcriptional regulator [Rhizobium paknamense]MDQ0455209.1 DNA-binding MarR family transcriptional regulator [Rhizobium paknamense]
MTDDLEAYLTLDQQLCFALYGATLAVTRTYKPLLESLGLTYPQYLTMMALWEEDGQGVKSLGEKLGLDSGTLSPLLKRLEQSGFITRRRDASDERQVTISLTEKGADLKVRAVDVMASIGDAMGCSLEEMASLREALHGLRDRLNAAQDHSS